MNAGSSSSTRILWRSDELESAELFIGRTGADGQRLEGRVVLPIDGDPSQIDYRIELDPGWRTRQATVVIDGGAGPRAITFAVDEEGRWSVDGSPVPALDGCVDIDLGFTPATNTLQIRRLGLEVGQSRALPVSWLAFAELEVEPVTQTYSRVGPDRWRFATDDFTADLLVDDEGYVLRYGEDLWRAVAHRRSPG